MKNSACSSFVQSLLCLSYIRLGADSIQKAVFRAKQ